MSGKNAIAIRLFRISLRAFSRDSRIRFEEEAAAAFADGWRTRILRSGYFAAWRYAAAAISDSLRAGLADRRRRAHGNPANAGGSRVLPDLITDLRYAFRRMRRSPGTAVAVIGILALGVGANSAVFSALRTAVLTPPPFPEAERLVLPQLEIRRSEGRITASKWSYPKFRQLREETAAIFQDLVLYTSRSASWSDPGRAESVEYEFVTPGYFRLLGQLPVAGRFFVTEEEGSDAAPGVAVLSFSAWQKWFAGDPSAVGSTITADGSRLRVVGVAPEGFRGLTGTAVFWTPVGQSRETMGNWATDGADSHWLQAIGLLRPGVTLTQARARLEVIGSRIGQLQSAEARSGATVRASLPTIAEAWVNPTVRTSVLVLAAASLMVLAIAVANLAALLLARGRREERETAVRLALGAARGRLVRASLVESVLYAAAGGGLGLVLSVWGTMAIRAGWPDRLLSGQSGDIRSVDLASVTTDWQVVTVGLLVALVSSVAFGVLPSLMQSSLDLVPALQRRAAGGNGQGHSSGRRLLLAGQLAFSIILLVGAGLLAGTLVRLRGQQEGFDHRNLLALGYTVAGRPAAESDESRRAFHLELMDRARAIPGVTDVALASTPPLMGHSILTGVSQASGNAPYPAEERPSIGITVVSSDHFTTLGVPVLQGRDFTPEEDLRSPQVMIINRRAASEFFGEDSPIGRQLTMGFSLTDSTYPITIVGVVDDVLYSRPASGVMPEGYLPLGLWAPHNLSLIARTSLAPAPLIPSFREVLASLDEDIPFWRVQTGEDLRAHGVADTRALVYLLAIFSGLALILSAAGVWAVVAQAVAERRREIGLRVALGAEGGQVERLMVRQSVPPILAGGIAGLAVAAYVARFIDTLLFQVGVHEPAVYWAAATFLALVALVAGWIPARRASRVDPMEVLTAE